MANDQSGPTCISRSEDTVTGISKKMISSTASFDSVLSLNQGEMKKDSTNSCSLKRKRPPTIEIPNVLREISLDKESISRECGLLKDSVCFSDCGFAVLSLKGKKKFMEDAHKIASCPYSKKKFFGVYDGHGGSKAAEFVVENLHSNIFGVLQNSRTNGPKEEAIKAGYLKTDQDFLNQGVSSGACCVTALIEDGEVVISNAGDCRAVLCRKGKAEALTTDHRAGHEAERRRIEKKGGFVQYHRGAWRVHGVLSVSRSIGDSHLKDWVLAEPDTKIIKLTQDMEFLLLASDGLWEEVSNEEAAEVVRRSCLGKENVQNTDRKQKENIEEHGTIKLSPSPKLRSVNVDEINSNPSPREKVQNADRELKENIDEHGTINMSPSPKLRRLNIHQINSNPSPKMHIVNIGEHGTRHSNPSPKLRRVKIDEINWNTSSREKVQNADRIQKENIDEHGTIAMRPSPRRLNIDQINSNSSLSMHRVSIDEQGTIHSNPSPKLRRVLIKSKRPGQVTDSRKMVESWKYSEDIFGNENDSPPSKAQRISVTNPLKRNKYSSQENSPIGRKQPCRGLLAACKELTNLAVTRGSLDDITVMIIDLNFFRH